MTVAGRAHEAHLNHALRLLVRVRPVLPVRVFSSEGARLHGTGHAHGQPWYDRSVSERLVTYVSDCIAFSQGRSGEPAAPTAATRSTRSSSCR